MKNASRGLVTLVVAAAVALAAALPLGAIEGPGPPRSYDFPAPPSGSFQDTVDRSVRDAGTPEVVARSGGLVRLDPSLEQWVDTIFQDLVREAKGLRPGLAFEWTALGSPHPNALALPGGRIFVTRGLFRLDLTGDELAGVLAHELVHTLYSHGSRNLVLGLFLNFFGNLILSDGGADLARRQVVALIGNLIANGYSREQELEADRIGQGLAYVAGYSLDGLSSALVKLDRYYGQGGESPLLELFSDHPFTERRLRILEEQAQEIRAGRAAPNPRRDG